MDPEPPITENLSKKRSISLRVQRMTVEYSYVRIPLTDDMLIFDSEGVGRVNTDLAFTRGLELAQESNLVWFYESEEIGAHPWQRPPDQEEKILLESDSVEHY